MLVSSGKCCMLSLMNNRLCLLGFRVSADSDELTQVQQLLLLSTHAKAYTLLTSVCGHLNTLRL